MSNIDTSIKNEAVIPTVDSRLFEGHEDARFAVGMLAIGNEVLSGFDDEYYGYLKLRARVYVDQTRMISPDLVRPDGTETDEDDARSVHFGLLERAERGARVIGGLRLITKTEEDNRPLPIEEFFPDVFGDDPAPLMATEASRYIVRHEDPAVQRRLSDPLFTAAVSFIIAHRLGPTYGVVEEGVEASLRMKGIPLKRVADPKFVPEYAADNLGIEIDTDMLAQLTERRRPGAIAEMLAREGDFVYFDTAAPSAPTPPPAPASTPTRQRHLRTLRSPIRAAA
jgi:N-acyl-L-homoserine lactone synthetase